MMMMMVIMIMRMMIMMMNIDHHHKGAHTVAIPDLLRIFASQKSPTLVGMWEIDLKLVLILGHFIPIFVEKKIQ